MIHQPTFDLHVLRGRCVTALAATAAIVMAVLTLTSCTYFDPPKEVTDRADAIRADVRALDGVKFLEIDVRARDFKDHPNDWIIALSVTTDSAETLSTVPSAIEQVVAAADVYAVTVTVQIPAGLGAAPVVIDDVDAAAVAAATQLRVLPQAASVQVSDDYTGTWIDATADTPLVEVALAVRGVPGFGEDGPLGTVTVGWLGGQANSQHNVEIGPGGPSNEVVEALEKLGAATSTSQISATEDTPYSATGGLPSRPVIDVSVDVAKPAVDLLVSVVDSAAVAGTRPRTAFFVTDAAGDTTLGYVGLPLGSLEPDDLPEIATPSPDPGLNVAVPSAVPVIPWVLSDDPAVLAQLDEYTGAVTALLAHAEEIAGVRGEPSTSIQECSTPGGGSSIFGHLTVPIFEVADSADAAFAAIVDSWSSEGLTYSDRALGLDLYANPAADAVVASATIRGTADGIVISVSSACA